MSVDNQSISSKYSYKNLGYYLVQQNRYKSMRQKQNIIAFPVQVKSNREDFIDSISNFHSSYKLKNPEFDIKT